MINAIGLDAAREEEADAAEGTSPGHDDHLPLSPDRISQTLHPGNEQQDSYQDSDTDGPMRATIAHDYTGESRLLSAVTLGHASGCQSRMSTQQGRDNQCSAEPQADALHLIPLSCFSTPTTTTMSCKLARRRGKRRWMSSSIDAIHTRMPGRRVWPATSKISSQPKTVLKMISEPDSPVSQQGSSYMHSEGDPAATSGMPEASALAHSSIASPSLSEGDATDPPAELLRERTVSSPLSGPSPSQSISVDDLPEGQYGVLEDEESRRAILAQKLQEVFSLPSAEVVLAEYPSWLFRSVLLQGFLYLTEAHLCFYAYIKGKEGQVVRSGTMYRRFPKSIMQSKYWFILKDDVLSWYSSSTNPYFPIDHIPLHYVTSIEPSPTHEDRFKIITPNKVYRFATESAKSQQEWIKILRKVAFRSQSAEDSIKVRLFVNLLRCQLLTLKTLSLRSLYRYRI